MTPSAAAVAGSSTNVVTAKVSSTTTVLVIATLNTSVLAPVSPRTRISSPAGARRPNRRPSSGGELAHDAISSHSPAAGYSPAFVAPAVENSAVTRRADR